MSWTEALASAWAAGSEQARQAGVELSCETIATDWQVKMHGLHEPMPAVLEALARCLSDSDEP